MTMQVPFVDLAAQYKDIAQDVDAAMKNVITKTAFILGQDVASFEQEFAAFCDTQYAIGVDSGTSALELILRAYGIGAGDEVITVANTFIATTLAISYTGATPVLVDIDPATYNLDVSKIEAAITPRTKAIMPVHLYGQPADMDCVLDIAKQHNLRVIEDASQAHGARYKGKRAGSLGDAAAFSFYPAKNLGAYGDGGMVVTNDPHMDEEIRMLRNYGQKKKYHHVRLGFNRRLDTLQAAVLRIKLQALDAANAARRQHAKQYHELLADCSIVLPTEADYAESVYHLYVIRLKDRDALAAHLQENGVASGIHYPVPIHLHAAHEDLDYQLGDFPISESYAEQILSLPMYPEMTSEMVDYTCDMIKQFVK